MENSNDDVTSIVINRVGKQLLGQNHWSKLNWHIWLINK